MPDTSGAVNLGSLSAEEQEAVNKLADANPLPEGEDVPGVPVHTAFVVVVDRDGDVQITTLEQADKIVPDHPVPSEDIVFGAASNVVKDIQTAATARATVEFQMAQMRHIQEQQQAAAISQQLAKNPHGMGGR